MGLVDTEALVLKTYSLAEADKIAVLLTASEGLVRGVAKGAKRLKSRFGGGLEPFSVVQISYFQKEERELVSIGRIELVKSYFESASNPLFLQKFAYLIDLLIEFAPPHDPNETLYRMAKVCLDAAAASPENLEAVALYFEIWILKLSGYLPDWSKCDVCRNPLDENADAELLTNFQTVCRQCQKYRGNRAVTAQQRKIFAAARKKSPSDFVAEASDFQTDARAISEILRRLISGILGKETVGERFLTANLQTQ